MTYNTATGAFDNYLVGTYDGYPLDLDVYFDPSGSGDSEVLLTIPLLFQGGFTDVDGTVTPISSVFNPADFVNSDIGLIDLGGTPDPALGVISFGPFDLGGYEDTFSINPADYAIDNFVTGLSNGCRSTSTSPRARRDRTRRISCSTVPLVFQVGFDDVAGAITPIFSVDPTDFLNRRPRPRSHRRYLTDRFPRSP